MSVAIGATRSFSTILMAAGIVLICCICCCCWLCMNGTSVSTPGGPENVTKLTTILDSMPGGCTTLSSALATYADSIGIIAIPAEQQCPPGTQDPPATGVVTRAMGAGFKTCNPTTFKFSNDKINADFINIQSTVQCSTGSSQQGHIMNCWPDYNFVGVDSGSLCCSQNGVNAGGYCLPVGSPHAAPAPALVVPITPTPSVAVPAPTPALVVSTTPPPTVAVPAPTPVFGSPISTSPSPHAPAPHAPAPHAPAPCVRNKCPPGYNLINSMCKKFGKPVTMPTC